MARTLSDTLKAQQKWGLISPPYVIAQIRRKWGGIIRYDFDWLYSGSEDDYLHTATMPGDGSLVRLRVTLPGDNQKLYYQRITNPDPESNFSSWTYLTIQNVVAIASASNSAEVSQFYINTSQQVYHRQSDDNGANWGSWTLLTTLGAGTINGMAAAYKENGDICLLFFLGNTLYRMKRVSASWGDPVADPLTLTGASGVSVCYDSDWLIIATVDGESTGNGVYVSMLGDATAQPLNSWAPWEAIIERTTGEPYGYLAPTIMV